VLYSEDASAGLLDEERTASDASANVIDIEAKAVCAESM